MPGLLEETADDASQGSSRASTASKLSKGVVLDKDGKPCRTCTSSSAWMSMMKSSNSKKSQSNSATVFTAVAGAAAATGSAATVSPSNDNDVSNPSNCPPDVEELGRSTWTLLHSLTASYPESPSPAHQQKTRSFLSLFSQLYPCWVCAEDFQEWIARPENEPKLKSPEDFGRWMCSAHNEVNRKLGKKEFDCNLWRERWKDGWKDGRCG